MGHYLLPASSPVRPRGSSRNNSRVTSTCPASPIRSPGTRDRLDLEASILASYSSEEQERIHLEAQIIKESENQTENKMNGANTPPRGLGVSRSGVAFPMIGDASKGAPRTEATDSASRGGQSDAGEQRRVAFM